MRKVKLYTGGGVSLSPTNGDGRTLSSYVRLIAEKNQAVTDGNQVLPCVDVLATEAENWIDCRMEMEEE